MRRPQGRLLAEALTNLQTPNPIIANARVKNKSARKIGLVGLRSSISIHANLHTRNSNPAA